MVTRRMIAMMLAGALVLAACGDDGGAGSSSSFGSGDRFSVTRALAQIPAEAAFDEDGRTEIRVADLLAVSTAIGVDRPTESTDEDEVAAWLRPMIGSLPSPVFAPLPPLVESGFVDLEAFRDEVGFGITEVDAFVSWVKLPQQGDVWSGDLDVAADTEVADGVRTLGEGDDFSIDIENRTLARPLGAPLRFAEADGLVLSTPDTAAAVAWLDDASPRLDADPRLSAAAGLLDEAGVVSADLFVGDFSVDAGEGATDGIIGEPFDTIAIGWADDNGDPVVTVVHVFADEAAATAAAPDVESALAAAPEVDRVVVAAEGRSVVSSVVPSLERPGQILDMVFRLQAPFVHS